MNNVKCVICHYKTYEITKRAIESFRKFYPTMQLTVVDGSGFDASSAWLYNFAREDGNTSIYAHNFNIHHGPGMHLGVVGSEVDNVFIFESDCTMLKGGVIEAMLETVDGKTFHSIGNELWVDINGMGSNTKTDQHIFKYIHPIAMLVWKPMYLNYYPFKKHGAPNIDVAVDLTTQGREDLLVGFSTADYLIHDGKGTRGKYGIQL